MNRNKTRRMVQMAVLAAIIILMAFTPIGYLPIGPLKLTLIVIPVAVGAMTLGPVGGLIMGGIFGITSFITCFGMDAFGTALMAISPVKTFILCIPTRMLAGLLAGLIFRGMRAHTKSFVSYLAGGFFAAFFNTLFFMGTLVLTFWDAPAVVSWNESLGGKGVLLFVILAVGINGLVEILTAMIVGGAAAKAVNKVMKQA